MKARFLPLALAGILLASPLAACNATLHSPRQIAEQADTDASLAYVGVAKACDAVTLSAATSDAQKASAKAIKRKAWAILSDVHAAYAAGSAIDLAPFADLLKQAKALKGA